MDAFCWHVEKLDSVCCTFSRPPHQGTKTKKKTAAHSEESDRQVGVVSECGLEGWKVVWVSVYISSVI